MVVQDLRHLTDDVGFVESQGGRMSTKRVLASPTRTAERHRSPAESSLRLPPRVRRREQPRIIVELLTKPHRALDRVRERYGPVCALGAGPFRMVLVGDPATLGELFRKPAVEFRWRHRFNWFGVLVGSSSMLTNDEPEHRRLRSAVQAGFSRRRLNRWIPMIVERTDVAIDRLLADTEPGEVVDLEPVLRSITLDVVLAALFGTPFAARAAEIGALMQSGHDFVARPTPPHRLPFGLQRRVRADRAAIDAIIDTEIAERREHPNGDPFDILDALVADGELTDGEIRDQVVTLIGAGFDTTAAALAWTLWRSTLETDLWQRLGVEADRVLGPVVGAISPSPDEHTLAELDLADRVMRESLRLHPPGALTPREAAVDVDIGGYFVPATTIVVWSAHLAGRDPRSWVDPLHFDPDRFLDTTDEQQAAMRAAWVPFGHGVRNCIGFALAQMELTLIVARLAQRLVLVPTASTVPEPVGVAVNQPDSGVPMHVRARMTAHERHASAG
jgi:cytochrome P450